MFIIDSHAHIGSDIDGSTQTAAELIKKMKESNIARTIIFPFTAENDIDFFRSNKMIADLTLKHPEFIGFGRVNPNRISQAIESLNLCVNLGLKGIKLHPKSQKFNFNISSVGYILEEIRKYNLPVIVHSGWAAKELEGILQCINQFGEVTFIMAHMFNCDYDCLKKFVKLNPPNVYFETSLFSCQSDLQWVIDSVGAEKIIFGSDAPYNHPRWEADKFSYLSLDQRQRLRIFKDNIMYILNK